MIKFHAINNPGTPKTDWILHEWMDDIYSDNFKDLFVPKVFGTEDKIEQEIFLYRLETVIPEFLVSHELRKMILDRIL